MKSGPKGINNCQECINRHPEPIYTLTIFSGPKLIYGNLMLVYEGPKLIYKSLESIYGSLELIYGDPEFIY